MSYGVASCKCKKCGEYFESRKKCFNSKQAREYEKWAEENVDLCPECYKSEQQALLEKKIAEINLDFDLPAITGVSEKQVAYAEKLRKIYVAQNAEQIKKIHKFFNEIEKEKLDEAIAESGKTEEEYIHWFILRMSWEKDYICLNETNASKVIDALKW